MNEMIVLAIVGLGGYYLYSHGYFTQAATGGSSTGSTGGGGSTTGGGTTTGGGNPAPQAPYVPPAAPAPGPGPVPNPTVPPGNVPPDGTHSTKSIYDQMYALSNQGEYQFTIDYWGGDFRAALVSAGLIPLVPCDYAGCNNYPWPASWGNFPGCTEVLNLQAYTDACGQPMTLEQFLALAVPYMQSKGVNANWGGTVQNIQGQTFFIPNGGTSGLSGGLWAV